MKKIIEKIKSNNKLYRALRTFFQAFIGVIAVDIATTDLSDIAGLKALIISAIAGGISALMNKNENEDKEDW